MPPGQRKLRDSCDSCHIAKVKCIKTKTGECLRCTSSGSICSFSPSDRRGKPRGAKNKCNRLPQVQTNGSQPTPSPLRVAAGSAKTVSASRTQARATAATANSVAAVASATIVPTAAVATTAPDDAYPSPAYEFEKYFSGTSHPEFGAHDGGWTLQTAEDVPGVLGLATSDETLASMVQTEWMNLDGGMVHESPSLQQHTPRTSVSSNAYLDPSLTSPQSFPMQVQPAQQGGSIFEGLPSPTPNRLSTCKCYPVNLQSLYTLHCQQTTSSSGHSTPFDVALYINNTAIERCHVMLSCTECVLNPNVEKSSTNMLMLAGAMDDILMSYSNTCAAYLDAAVQDPLVFSSGCGGGDNGPMSSSSGCSTPPRLDEPEFITRAHSTSSSSTSVSSRTSNQLSLGTYRVEGEDGYHLKLEILKIELRKVERLWIAFRDTCAMQKFEDEQKSLYAALVCYLAKKLRRTAEMLEARKRILSTNGW